MAISPKSTSLFFFLLISISLFSRTVLNASPESESESEPDLVSELLSLQARSESGVIRLDSNSVNRFLMRNPRPYSILLFFDASHVHDNPELHLEHFRSEFGLVASSFISHNKGSAAESKLFFCDVDYEDSSSTFVEFGVESVPHIRLISPDIETLKDSDEMEGGDFSRMASSMAQFVESRTKLSVGPIKRPPMFTNKQLGFFGVAILACIPYIGKKVLKGETFFHDSKIWLALALLVYFFGVSGAMHNIIREMPMFLRDQKHPSSLIFFYEESGIQLGAESFAIGCLYAIVGLLLALATQLLVKVKSVNAQTLVMAVGLFTSVWAVREVIHLNHWKTGYEIHGYWPSSWN